jgi:hypothetical protein
MTVKPEEGEGQTPAFLYCNTSCTVHMPLADDVVTVGGVAEIIPPG